MVNFVFYLRIIVKKRHLLYYHYYLSLVVRKPVFSVSDKVRHKPGSTTKGLKFRIKVVQGLYYPYSENKGADQLRGYREADLRLCFRICKKLVFP